MSDLPPAPRPRNWTRWLLLASLVINGLLGGYVVGRAFMHHPPPPPMMGAPGMPGGMGGGGLTPPLREAVKNDLKHREIKQRVDAIREARIAIRDAMLAEPFDRDRLDKAFDGLLDSQQALQRDLQRAASGAVARMSPEERKRVADWRPEGREGREGRRERDGPPR